MYEDKYKDFLNSFLNKPNTTATPVPTLPDTKPKTELKSEFIPTIQERPKIQNNFNHTTSSMLSEDIVIDDLPLGKFYFQGTRIQIRELSVKEIQHFSTIDETAIYDFKEKINDILDSCILFTNPDGTPGSYLDIKEGDRIWIIYHLREKTFKNGKTLSVSVDYTENDEKKKIDIELIRQNMDLYRDEEIMNWFSAEKRCFVFETEIRKEPFIISPPTIGLKRCFDSYLRNQVEMGIKPNTQFFKIAPYLHPHETYLSKNDIDKLLHWFENSMSVEEYDFLYDLINNHLKIGIRGLKKKVGDGFVTTTQVYPTRLKTIFMLPNAFYVFLKK